MADPAWAIYPGLTPPYSVVCCGAGLLYSWSETTGLGLGRGSLFPDATPGVPPPGFYCRSFTAGTLSAFGASYLVQFDGTLWVTGYGYLGLGVPAPDIQTVFVQIGTDRDWAYVCTNGGVTYAIKNNGDMWGWGDNAAGILGAGTIGDVLSPIFIGTDFAKVVVSSASVEAHAIAIKKDGSIWGIGNNNFGQLGLGDIISRTTWTQAGTDVDWKDIQAEHEQSLGSEGYTLATKTDGTMWGAGSNSAGELGVGDFTDRTSYTQAGIDTDWKEIGTVPGRSYGIKTDGTLWKWGEGVNAPTQYGSDTDWDFLFASWCTLIGKVDGTLWFEFDLSQYGTQAGWQAGATRGSHYLALR